MMMKKYTLVLVLAVLISPDVWAQSDSLKLKILSDSIAGLYARYLNLSNSIGSSEKAYHRVDEKIKLLENQSQGNTEKLNKISTAEKRTFETIYKNSKLSFIATANFVDGVNTALNALEFTVSSLDYSNAIFELNNPTNADLGFSLDKVILKIVDDKIINNSKNGRKFGDRLKSIVSGILNNPIINNPITKAIVSTVPAVSSISSVFNVVNSLAVGETSIGAEILKDFSKDLQKYVAHYEALARASRDLEFNLSNLRVKTDALRKLANNFVNQSVVDLYTRENLPNISGLDMNTLVKKYFNYASTSEYIAQLEQKNTMNYEYLSRRLVYPMFNRSKVSFIVEDLERLYNEQVSTLNTYHQSIIIILNNATHLSEDTGKITNKIYTLDAQFKNLLSAYEKNVDLSNLKALEANVPRY